MRQGGAVHVWEHMLVGWRTQEDSATLCAWELQAAARCLVVVLFTKTGRGPSGRTPCHRRDGQERHGGLPDALGKGALQRPGQFISGTTDTAAPMPEMGIARPAWTVRHPLDTRAKLPITVLWPERDPPWRPRIQMLTLAATDSHNAEDAASRMLIERLDRIS